MAEEQGAKPPKDTTKILTLGFMALNILVLAAGVYMVFVSTIGYTSPSVSEGQLTAELDAFRERLRSKPVMYTMEPFNTNLDGDPRRLIRVRINLEMLDEEGFEEVIGLGAEARDAIVRILNSKTFTDIETVQGKLQLKTQIVSQLNDFLEQGVVKNVYFSEFAIQ